MALLLAGAIAFTPSPSPSACDLAVDLFVSEMESKQPSQLQNRLPTMIAACEEPPEPPAPAGTVSHAPSRGIGGNVEQWRALVAAYFPSDQVDRALCIISYESGGNPGAKNPRSSARGLFQILGSLWAPYYGISQDALYDPATNVNIAVKIWGQSGWSAWSPYKRGQCR